MRLKDGADAERIGAREHAKIARTVPDRIGLARNMIVNRPANEIAAQARMKPVDAAAHPAIAKGRPDGDEASGARIGPVFESQAGEHAAHAMANDMNDLVFGPADKFPQTVDIIIKPLEHGLILELARPVTELAQAMPEGEHFLAIDHRSMDKDDRGGNGRFPFWIRPRHGNGHHPKIDAFLHAAIGIFHGILKSLILVAGTGSAPNL